MSSLFITKTTNSPQREKEMSQSPEESAGGSTSTSLNGNLGSSKITLETLDAVDEHHGSSTRSLDISDVLFAEKTEEPLIGYCISLRKNAGSRMTLETSLNTSDAQEDSNRSLDSNLLFSSEETEKPLSRLSSSLHKSDSCFSYNNKFANPTRRTERQTRSATTPSILRRNKNLRKGQGGISIRSLDSNLLFFEETEKPLSRCSSSLHKSDSCFSYNHKFAMPTTTTTRTARRSRSPSTPSILRRNTLRKGQQGISNRSLDNSILLLTENTEKPLTGYGSSLHKSDGYLNYIHDDDVVDDIFSVVPSTQRQLWFHKKQGLNNTNASWADASSIRVNRYGSYTNEKSFLHKSDGCLIYDHSCSVAPPPVRPSSEVSLLLCNSSTRTSWSTRPPSTNIAGQRSRKMISSSSSSSSNNHQKGEDIDQRLERRLRQNKKIPGNDNKLCSSSFHKSASSTLNSSYHKSSSSLPSSSKISPGSRGAGSPPGGGAAPPPPSSTTLLLRTRLVKQGRHPQQQEEQEEHVGVAGTRNHHRRGLNTNNLFAEERGGGNEKKQVSSRNSCYSSSLLSSSFVHSKSDSCLDYCHHGDAAATTTTNRVVHHHTSTPQQKPAQEKVFAKTRSIMPPTTPGFKDGGKEASSHRL